jgi:hypothetical protein
LGLAPIKLGRSTLRVEPSLHQLNPFPELPRNDPVSGNQERFHQTVPSGNLGMKGVTRRVTHHQASRKTNHL